MLFNPYECFVMLDAKAQAVFDRFVFFIMRLGVSKAFIRYLVWSVMILSMSVGVLCDLTLDPFGIGLLGLVPAVFPMVMFFRHRHGNRRDDLIAEERGRASRADNVYPERLMIAKMLAWGAVAASVILMPVHFSVWSHSTTRHEALASLLNCASFWGLVTSFFSIVYLIKTPPAAPPAEIRQLSLVHVNAKE